MKQEKKNKHHLVDASGKTLGRIASRIAFLLRGKDQPNFNYHQDQGAQVIVENADKIKLTGNKLEQKKYRHYSGYPGGLKEKKAQDLSKTAMLRKAVYGMLPANRMRAKILKRLIIKK